MHEFKLYEVSDSPPGSRAGLEKINASQGYVPNVHAIMAGAPQLLNGYIALREQFAGSTLDEQERKIVMLAVSRELGSAYDAAAHSVMTEQHRVPAEVIDAVRVGTQLADKKLEALRRFTMNLVSHGGRVSEACFHDFLAAGYTRANALEIVLAVGAVTLTGFTNRLAKVPADTGMQFRRWQEAAEAGSERPAQPEPV